MERSPQRLLDSSLSNVQIDLPDQEIPTAQEVRLAIPDRCFERSTMKSLTYTAISLGLTLGTALAAGLLVPVSWAWAPVWVAYAVVCGTFGTGVWVVAHECGHGAYSNNKKLADTIGFVLHSVLLVPYFSWQRSHAIHHAKTNHLTDGETHVPKVADQPDGINALAFRRQIGPNAFAALFILIRLGIGWPLYLIMGVSGGPSRGTTNHFWPWPPFSNALFPKRLAPKVLFSAAGVISTIVGLGVWAATVGSITLVILLYVGPYLVVNAWLVTYTWLQHTNEDIPHYDKSEWSFVKGAFCSVDRPYGRVFNFLHHNIGSTHVAHHLVSSIPHYHAVEATKAIAKTYPALYRFDPTPISQALWAAGKSCVAVEDQGDGWWYVIPPSVES